MGLSFAHAAHAAHAHVAAVKLGGAERHRRKDTYEAGGVKESRREL